MSSFWLRHMKGLLTASAVVVLAMVVGISFFLIDAHHSRSTAPPGRRSEAPTPSSTKLVFHRPKLVSPPNTSVEKAVQANAQKAAASSAPIRQVPQPAPAVSRAFPAISRAARRDPATYALAFTTELLDLNFAIDTRSQLARWVVSESSIDAYPSTPPWLETEDMYVSAFTTEISGTGSSPIPSAAQWAADGAAHVTWKVSDVSAHVTSGWTAVVAAGYVPPDPRMTVQQVTGILTRQVGSQPPTTETFSMRLALSSAFYHHGYGAGELGMWETGS